MDESRRVAVLGVTGFIGQGLPAIFADKGYACTGISRSRKGDVRGVDCWQRLEEMDLTGHEAVVNLSGEPVTKRWNETNKRRFYESRVGVTRQIVEAMRKIPAEGRPRVLVNGSAVGIYGDRGDEVLIETSASGRGYLAELCLQWEDAAREAEALGVRVVCLRTGIVLGRDGGALKQMLPVFKAGLGGRLGSGRQWMPWIHVDDHRRAIRHAVCEPALTGALNLTAPAAERNAGFTGKLAAVLRRPAVFPVPGFMLKLVFDGFGGAMLSSQHARPAALEAAGFKFGFPTLESALADLVA